MSDEILKYINCRYIYNIHEKSDTDYKCPYCGNGVLRCCEGDLYYFESPESKALRNDESWEPDWIEYLFSASLRCKACSEIILCSGTGTEMGMSIQGDKEELSKLDPEDWISRDFVPKYFVPSLTLCQIPNELPNTIKNDIKVSFSLAFSDFSASGNRLRSALEKLTLHLLPNSNSNFHQRLKELQDVDSEASEILMSIKWLGNEASHESSLKHYDMAYAFEALAYVLARLFDEAPKKIRSFASRINVNKGSIAKT
ncbi:MAG: DUF4145 domain-containing protein [Thalassolituus sp.]